MFRRSLFRRWGSRASSHVPVRRARLLVEQLEARTVPAIYPLTPVEVRHAYGFDQISGDGTGQTIAIINAYDAPNIFKDADVFSKQFSWTDGGASLYSQFGASSSYLTKVKMSSNVRGNVGWAQEISLDVEWAHAIAPAAKIMLVEARSNSINDLLAAVDYASNHGAQVVSMSWGSGEFSSEALYDSHFLHAGVTYVAASGDTGGVVNWPAVSPNVVAVGGTALSIDVSGAYLSEATWSGSGGGVSKYETKPSFQSALSGSKRSTPDLAYDASPSTGFWVYDSYGAGGWGQYGGTSAGAPQIAAMIALANQGRSTALSSATTLSAVYGLYGSADYAATFHDVTTGKAGAFTATTGFDLATGIGTPKANGLISFLRSGTTTSTVSSTSTSSTASTSATANTTFKVVLLAPRQVIFNSEFPGRGITSASGSATMSVAQPTQMPFILAQAQASPPSNRLQYQVGQVLDPDEEESDQPKSSTWQQTFTAPPIQSSPEAAAARGQWLPAVDAAFGQDLQVRNELEALPALPIETQAEDSSLISAMALVGAALVVGTGRGTPEEQLKGDRRRYWAIPR